MSEAWGSFDTDDYAREVLATGTWDKASVSAASADQVAALRYVPEARGIHLRGDHPDLSPLTSRRGLERLFVFGNTALTDIAPMASMRSLTDVGLSLCPEVRDLSPLSDLPLTYLSLSELHPELPAEQLEPLTEVRYLSLGHRFAVDSIGELKLSSRLRSLFLIRDACELSLEGIEQWTELEAFRAESPSQFRYVCRTPFFRRLRQLSLARLNPLNLAELADLTALRTLMLTRCRLPHGLEPLRELPSLTQLHLYAKPEDAPYDLAPLAGLDGLTIHLGSEMEATGTDLFPPERIVRLG
ncbi:hypothetical protein GCM10009647_028390 [Streptomyces sanglieri]